MNALAHDGTELRSSDSEPDEDDLLFIDPDTDKDIILSDPDLSDGINPHNIIDSKRIIKRPARFVPKEDCSSSEEDDLEDNSVTPESNKASDSEDDPSVEEESEFENMSDQSESDWDLDYNQSDSE